PTLYPSVYFERTREEYYHLLQSVRATGDWEAWIRYFVTGLKAQSENMLALVQTISSVQNDIRGRIREVRRQASLIRVIEAFFMSPVQRAQDVADHAQLSFATAQSAIVTLQGLGLLREISGRQRGRVYACTPLLNALFDLENRL
ncbi:MAG: hypothetical protein ABL962_16275, partial [Fimbriimonadaceae bacterium]